MQEAADGVVGVCDEIHGSTPKHSTAQHSTARHSNEAMAASVTFALCLFHASQSPFLRRRTPAQLQETHNAALARLLNAQCRGRQANGWRETGDSGDTAFTVYRLPRSHEKNHTAGTGIQALTLEPNVD